MDGWSWLTPFVQVNKLEKGHDTNVSGVWKEGVNGAGVTIAVVDDGEWMCTAVLMLPWQLTIQVWRG